MADIARAVVGAVVLVVALMAGVAIVDPIAQQAPGAGGGTTSSVYQDGGVLTGVGNYVKLDSGIGTNETAYKTTGYAINLTGASDSYVQSQSSFSIASDQNWTVSAWGYVDPEASNDNMTLVSANGRAILSYNGPANQWEGWYYDEGARNSYQVTIAAAGNETGNFTNVMLIANGTHLAIYRNGTRGGVADLSVNGSVDAPVGATNWNGRLEEVRTFNESANATRRAELVNSPVEQQHDMSPTSRAMFDQPNSSTQLLLYTNTYLTTSNVTYSAGFSEIVLSSGTDYQWQTGKNLFDGGPRIKPLSGGAIENAPVAYADYQLEETSTLGTIVPTITGGFSSFVGLAALLPVIIIVVVILIRVRTI